MVAVAFVRVKEPFNFAIALWVFDSAENLLDALSIKEFLEITLASYVTGELTSMVTYTLAYRAVSECVFQARDACRSCCTIALRHCEQCSARIILDGKNPNAIVWSLMPIDVHSG